jgi:hypothetical protein
MFNAPGARHGGTSGDLTLYIHCCSGEPDEIVSIDLIDFDPKERPGSLAPQGLISWSTGMKPRSYDEDRQRYVRERVGIDRTRAGSGPPLTV